MMGSTLMELPVSVSRVTNVLDANLMVINFISGFNRCDDDNPCDPNALCMDPPEIDDIMCFCNIGYTGDGRICAGLFIWGFIDLAISLPGTPVSISTALQKLYVHVIVLIISA